jgi:hypothetical protein
LRCNRQRLRAQGNPIRQLKIDLSGRDGMNGWPIVAAAPPKVCGNGLAGPAAVAAARFAPNTETTEPGATAATGVLPAPSCTPAGATYGTLSRIAITAHGAVRATEPAGDAPLRSPDQLRNLKPANGVTLTFTVELNSFI